MNRALDRKTTLLLAAAACLTALGCRSASPSTQPAPRDSSATLVAYIGDQPYVTAEAAYRATYALANDGASFDGDFAALRSALLAAKLIDDWDYDAATFIHKHAIGVMICRACKIRTGLNWNLTGAGRYAWRELIYHRIARPSGELGLISGGEFVSVLLKAEEYLKRTSQPESGPVDLAPPSAPPAPATQPATLPRG
jgi:hypothetical protein